MTDAEHEKRADSETTRDNDADGDARSWPPRTPRGWDGGQRPGRPSAGSEPGCLAVLLGVSLVLVGAFTALLGPLMAVACADCLDGIRGPLRFGTALVALAHYVVPLVTVASLVVMARSGHRERAGAIGLCVTLLLALIIMGLGRVTA